MPQWVRNLVMLGVFAAWLVFICVLFAQGTTPPLPDFAVPGVTYILLSGRVIRFGKDGVTVDKEDGK